MSVPSLPCPLSPELGEELVCYGIKGDYFVMIPVRVGHLQLAASLPGSKSISMKSSGRSGWGWWLISWSWRRGNGQ